MRSPNPEQQAAIKHPGGLLLKAGAGSGKTSVLVARIIHLTEQFIKKNESSDLEKFSRDIRKFFSRIVLMTFTKKAAGEISLRVRNSLRDKSEEPFWQMAMEASPSLTISTIHGFCLKLLKQGHFPKLDPEVEIVDETEMRHKIQALFEEWLERGACEFSHMRDTLNANHKNLVNTLKSIFADPALRTSWNKANPQDSQENALSDFFKEYFSLKEWDILLAPPPSFEEKKKWSIFLENFFSIFSIGTIENIEKTHNFLSENRTPGTNSFPAELLPLFSAIKGLKAFLKKHFDDLQSFELHKEQLADSVNALISAVHYLEKNFKRDSKISYSDLEYGVLEGLKNAGAREKIAESLDHIIVDEFQDTSYVQFSIIQNIVMGDFQKLFCVGDEKQAIYGFRGGEVGVFKKCAELIPEKLSMTSNYRSSKSVVDFNNRLFQYLLSKKGPISMAQQKTQSEEAGMITQISSDITNEKKTSLGRKELEVLEAEQIFNILLNIREENPDEGVTVLYKNLAPSKILIGRLLSENVPFVAQVKVPRSEDPVIGLYTILLEYVLLLQDPPKKCQNLDEYPAFMIRSYFNLLGLPNFANLPQLLSTFPKNISLYGASFAFLKFVHDLGLANANHSNNIKFIESIENFLGNDLEGAYLLLKKMGGDYSIDFYFGKDPAIKIMTVHGSKGLEFDHVVIGGIHTNGAGRGSADYFGKMAGSLKWKESSNQKTPFQSPAFILEQEISKHKELQESHRLFYVACTRAKKGLHWVNILLNGSEKNYGKDSWIVWLRNWLALGETEGINFTNRFPPKPSAKPEVSTSVEPPLFHRDNMGLVEKDNKSPMIFLPQLSVTRLASITECPRKFYLQNICKFDPDGMNPGKQASKKGHSSSLERGLQVHDQISQMIKGNWSVPQGPHEAILHWLKKKLRDIFPKSCEFQSEVPIKFSIFGHMVSGVADLVILQNNSPVSVWDFKTGARKKDKEIPYRFQLACYMQAFADKYKIPSKSKKVELALAYVDQKEIIKEEFFLSEITEQISREWRKLNELEQVNLRHCPSCPYSKLCEPL